MIFYYIRRYSKIQLKKSHRLFIDGTRTVLTSRMVDKNASSLNHYIRRLDPQDPLVIWSHFPTMYANKPIQNKQRKAERNVYYLLNLQERQNSSEYVLEFALQSLES